MDMKIHKADTGTELSLPFADEGVKAGFPSPAQDYASDSIDFNADLIQNADSTYYVRVIGDSMIDDHIEEGDLLVVDTSLEAKNGSLAICLLDGEATLKRIHRQKEKLFLLPANKRYQPIEVLPENEFVVWGVVIYNIKKAKAKPAPMLDLPENM